MPDQRSSNNNNDIEIDVVGDGRSELRNILEEYRLDEKWSERHEKLAEEWLKVAEERSAGHDKLGKKFKCKHYIFGLPALLIPLVFSPVSVVLENDPSLPYVSMTGFILSGVFAGVDKFFDHSAKHQKHMEYSARYGDIASDVKYELAQARRFRVDPDRFLMKIQQKLDYTGASAPDL